MYIDSYLTRQRLLVCGGWGCACWGKLKKTAKNKLTWSDFTNFYMQVFAFSNSFRFRSFCTLHIQNLSNRCRQRHDPSISRIFLSNFWRVFDVWHNCVAMSRWHLFLFAYRCYFWAWVICTRWANCIEFRKSNKSKSCCKLVWALTYTRLKK